MKQNMKRMLLVLCMAVCFFALSACGSASEEAVEPISPEIEQTMSDGAKSYLEQFASYSDEDLAAQLKQAEKQKNTVIESAISSWTSSKDDLGKMGEIQSVTVERADDDSYTAVVQASFEKRNLTFSLTAEESVSSKYYSKQSRNTHNSKVASDAEPECFTHTAVFFRAVIEGADRLKTLTDAKCNTEQEHDDPGHNAHGSDGGITVRSRTLV